MYRIREKKEEKKIEEKNKVVTLGDEKTKENLILNNPGGKFYIHDRKRIKKINE